ICYLCVFCDHRSLIVVTCNVFYHSFMNDYGSDALTIDIVKAFLTCWIFHTFGWEVYKVPAWWTIWLAVIPYSMRTWWTWLMWVLRPACAAFIIIMALKAFWTRTIWNTMPVAIHKEAIRTIA